MMLNWLDKCDKRLSDFFHHLDNRIATFILHPFALMFNPSFIIVPICVVYALSRSKIMTSFYIFCILLSLLMTLITKKALNRNRPQFYGHLKYKTPMFRSKEKNCSLPSGDSIQATNFALTLFFVAENYNTYFSEQSLTCLLPSMVLFVILVMLGRVYFMCHYILDTVLGVIMGYGLTVFL